MKKIVKTFLIVALAAACSRGEEDYGPDETEKPEPDPIRNERPLPPPTALRCDQGTWLTYENFGNAFLSTYCTTCHHSELPQEARSGAPIAANFDSAYLAQIWRASILQKTMGDAPTMPPAQNVSDQEKREFSEWLNCGAPED